MSILTTIPRTREIFLNEITHLPELKDEVLTYFGEFNSLSLILTPYKTLPNELTEVIVSIRIK